MAKDLFEELAQQQVPETPKEMDREIRAHLNRSVTFGYVVEFIIRAIPHTFLFFTRAILGLLIYTISGTDQLESIEEENEKESLEE